MNLFPIVMLLVLFGAVSLFAQTEPVNKQPAPVSLAELAAYPICDDYKISQLNDAIKANAKDTDLYLKRAHCFYYVKNQAFLKDISAILELNPSFERNLYRDISSLIIDKSPDQTRKNLDYLAAANPNHWYLYDKRSQLKLAQKDYKGAIEDGVKAIEQHPTGIGPETGRIQQSLYELFDDKSVFGLYDIVFNAARKKQRELTAKLKKSSPGSKESQAIWRGIEQLGSFLPILCRQWAGLGVRLGNPQIENAALEKMVQNETPWRGYQTRSEYYKSKIKNPQKAFADEVSFFLFHIEWLKEKIKYTASEKEQTSHRQFIGYQYVNLGDLYFRNQQYVKAIDSYEKAKSYYGFPQNLEFKINGAIKKLNLPVEQLK